MSTKQSNSSRLMIVVGEASGDLHGANLIHELKKTHPEINCYGIGGEKMRLAGVDILTDASELSVVGLVEVIKHYPRLNNILKRMKQELKGNPPDLLVLIDSPDFNLRLAKTAKKNGVKVLYYISPQIWAWRSSRIKTIKKYIDMMAVVFPFEVKFYKNAGVPAEYVGHPLVDDAIVTVEKDEIFAAEKLDKNKKLIGLFPGSRASEIEYNYPVLIEAAALLLQQRNDIQFITPIASTLSKSFIQNFIGQSDAKITTTTTNIYNVIHACDAIAAVSGTVTLQITLLQTPMLIVYRISPITYRIFSKIVKFTFAGIANVIAKKLICREFIQGNATAKNIAHELEQLLSNKNYISEMKNEMGKIKKHLGEKNGSAATAKLASDLITSG